MIWKTLTRISALRDEFHLPEDAIFTVNRMNRNRLPEGITWCKNSNADGCRDSYVHELQFPVRVFDTTTHEIGYGHFSLFTNVIRTALQVLDNSCPSMQETVQDTILAIEEHSFSRVLNSPWNVQLGMVSGNSKAVVVLNNSIWEVNITTVEFLCDQSKNKEYI
jgi:hypothetical protein